MKPMRFLLYLFILVFSSNWVFGMAEDNTKLPPDDEDLELRPVSAGDISIIDNTIHVLTNPFSKVVKVTIVYVDGDTSNHQFSNGQPIVIPLKTKIACALEIEKDGEIFHTKL